MQAESSRAEQTLRRGGVCHRLRVYNKMVTSQRAWLRLDRGGPTNCTQRTIARMGLASARSSNMRCMVCKLECVLAYVRVHLRFRVQ